MKINDFVNDYPRQKFGGKSARQMFKEVKCMEFTSPLHLLKIVNRGIKNRAFSLAIYVLMIKEELISLPEGREIIFYFITY
ncbi:MAG: hypothetical protein IJ444_03300 [Kiritimatiellae bacterium]|nr:hypothetical protein [Kiritimatiellia bacterium]